MTPLTRKVLLLRDAGVVQRSHTCRTLKDRNVAEHSHGVAMLALLLYQSVGFAAPAVVLMTALVHDLSEIATGDMPAPVKRQHPALRAELNKVSTAWEEAQGIRYSLQEDQAALLLWCDRMDFALYSLEEVSMGNGLFKSYLNRILYWLTTMPVPACEPGMDRAAIGLLHDVLDRAHIRLGHEITQEDAYE